jgi:hypothetical protein
VLSCEIVCHVLAAVVSAGGKTKIIIVVLLLKRPDIKCCNQIYALNVEEHCTVVVSAYAATQKGFFCCATASCTFFSDTRNY